MILLPTYSDKKTNITLQISKKLLKEIEHTCNGYILISDIHLKVLDLTMLVGAKLENCLRGKNES